MGEDKKIIPITLTKEFLVDKKRKELKEQFPNFTECKIDSIVKLYIAQSELINSTVVFSGDSNSKYDENISPE